MTEPQQFEWIPGWKYDTRDGRKAECAIAIEDGRAVFFDRNLGTSWIVKSDGRSVMCVAICDIVAGPDVPEDAVDYSDEDLERLCDEQEQLEKKLNDEADEVAECAFHNGYRQAMMDAAELAIGCIGKDKRCDVAQLVRSLFRGYLIPTAEPPF